MFHALTENMGSMIKFGHVDTITETSLLLSPLALPREGHLETASHVMVYLRQKYNSRLLHHLSCPEIDHKRLHDSIEF